MSRISINPEKRRQQLLDIGLDLYLKHGANGFSIKDVVQEDNVAIGLFYYYFKSKDEFITEIINNYIDSNIAVMKQALIFEDLKIVGRIERSIDLYYESLEKLLPYKENQTFNFEHHYQLETKLIEQFLPLVQSLIEDGVNLGLFECSNARLMAGYIIYGISSLSYTSDIILNEQTKKELLQLILQTLNYKSK